MKDIIDDYVSTQKRYDEMKGQAAKYLLYTFGQPQYSEKEYLDLLETEERLRNTLKGLENEITEKLEEGLYFEVDSETVLTISTGSDEFRCVSILKKYKEKE